MVNHLARRCVGRCGLAFNQRQESQLSEAYNFALPREQDDVLDGHVDGMDGFEKESMPKDGRECVSLH